MSNIFYTLPPDKLIALTAYGEAATEGTEGLMAVINVIINRMRDPQSYADKSILSQTNSLWHAVILKPYQFSIYNAADPSRQRMEYLARTFDNAVQTNPILSTAYKLAQYAVNGTLADNTGGSTHYHADYVSPAWSKTLERITQIGRHIFYSAYPAWQRVRAVIGEAVEAVSPYTIYILFGLMGLGAVLYLKRKRRIK
jgi:spore germination cell wall hydrolase CwlJ-like protein